MLRRHAVWAACTAAFTALGLASFPASAAPPPAPSAPAPQVPSGVLSALARDLGITADQARTRVANEAAGGLVADSLRKDLATRFAGAWFTGDTSRLVVAATDADGVRAARAAGAQARLAEHSLAELTAAKDALDRAARTVRTVDAAPVWYVDVRANRVVVRAAQPARATALVSASGVDRDLVRIVKSAEKPRQLYDIRGGDAYYIGSGSRCSVGFSVTRGTQGGFVTAGHCGRQGATTTGYNRVAQGTFQGSSFPGNDYAWVATNSDWTPRPWVKGPGGQNVIVRGSTQAAVGAAVCRSGSTTGWHCGTIQQHNTSVTYPQGTVSGVTRTTVCAEPGDSGGSYISNDQAQGVTSGGSGNCSSGGTTYYQPVNEILQTYGLTLTTEGGTEPPTGCDSTQERFSGSISSNQRLYQPSSTGYQSDGSGTHIGCLDGPDGVDFDVYLQKLNGSTWSTVAESTSPGPDEEISYNGTAGTYRYQVHAYSGSGAYTLGLTRPE